MKQPELVIQSMRESLKLGGRIVVEFGGKGNVASIQDGLAKGLQLESEIDIYNPWYFPSIEEYASLLEKFGFEVIRAQLFDPPTELKGGKEGLRYWLEMFAADFFPNQSVAERKSLYEKVAKEIAIEIYDCQNEQWIVDYRRIRIVARKK